jgi:hypothetical protein
MAAISPYYVHSVNTVDAQIGLSADLTGMLIDSCSASAERDEVEHQNFAAVPTVHIARSPKYTLTFGAKVMAHFFGAEGIFHVVEAWALKMDAVINVHTA